MDEPTKFLVVPHQNGTVDIVMFDSSDETWSEGMSAARSLYPAFVEIDFGNFGEDGCYVTFGPEETE